MIRLNIHEIKPQLSKYIEMVEAGETVVVCKRNVPVAEIRPIEKHKKKTPELGWAEGAIKLGTRFKQLSNAELAQWEGDEKDPLHKYSPRPKRRLK